MAKNKAKKKNKNVPPPFKITMGRPPSYSSPEEMIPIIEKYLNNCIVFRWIPSKAGLRIALGFSRESYREYREKTNFVDTMRKVENFIEESWVQRLTSQSTAGIVFYLKNAFKDDYRDKQELEHSGGLSIGAVLDQLEKDKNKNNGTTSPTHRPKTSK